MYKRRGGVRTSYVRVLPRAINGRLLPLRRTLNPASLAGRGG